MMRLSSFTVIIAFIAVALGGLALAPFLTVRLFPSDTMPAMTVSYAMPGSSSRIIEGEVTGKLEGLITGVAGVKEVRSSSRNGSGDITVSFDRHCDLAMARFEIVSIIRQAWEHLPQGVSYPTVTMHLPDAERSRLLISYTINSYASPIDIQRYCEEYIKPALADIDGVESVSIYGAQPLEWRLMLDFNKATRLGISMEAIRKAITSSSDSRIIGEGRLNGPDDEKQRILLEVDTPEDSLLLQLPIKLVDNRLVRLRDIASLEHAEKPADRHYRVNGRNSVYVNIAADQSANQVALAKEVRAEVERLQNRMPEGYSASLLYDASTPIESELDKIYFRSFLTLVIILLFVIIIARSWRYTLMITTGILLTLGIACLFYHLLGIEIHLYSLAGITISLNLIIDNLIVMADHLKRRSDLKVFTSILAASLTTVGALCVVFFLDEATRINLTDFVWVIIINLCVSLVAALFLVPALVVRLGLDSRRKGSVSRRKAHIILWLNHAYLRINSIVGSHKTLTAIIVILAFGFPVFLIPDQIKSPEKEWQKKYNQITGTEFFREVLRPAVDVVFGGTMRLFAEKVPEGGYFARSKADLRLQINASLPNGSTIDQMNTLISRMERFIEGFEEIKRFETTVYNGQRASISVEFKPQHVSTAFPYHLKAEVIKKALTLGGGSWNVFGLEDIGFNNEFYERSGSSVIKLTGYNYEDLNRYARQVADSLLANRRIKAVDIRSEVSFWKDDYSEFYLEIDRRKLAEINIGLHDLFNAIRPYFGQNVGAGRMHGEFGAEDIVILYGFRNSNDVWAMLNIPVAAGNRIVRLTDIATLEQRQAPQNIAKENQQYVLFAQYEYIGSFKQDQKIQNSIIERFNASLPMGYRLEKFSWMQRRNDDGEWSKYWLLLFVGIIIFFIASILFDSLRQPLAIIAMIPPSFIGIFLAFYLMNVNFDQGGFASFILLSGITVNAAIYVISEFNSIRKSRPHLSQQDAYITAFNHKIIPILLTVISTVLGFVPFVIGTLRESFWYPMAIGTIGGLIMSVLILVVVLPAMLLRAR